MTTAPTGSAPATGPWSIKRKMVLMIMLVSTTAMLLSGISFIAYEWLAFRRRMVSDLVGTAQIVGDNSTGALSFDDPRDAAEVLRALRAKAPIEFACVFRADGSVLATYQRDQTMIVPAAPASTVDGFEFREGRLIVWRSVDLDGRRLGSVYLRSDLSELSASLRQRALVVAIAILLSGAIAYALASGAQRAISGPVLALAATARRISDSRDYSVRATRRSTDEIGLLTDAFNLMLEQVQSRDSALRESEDKYRTFVERARDGIAIAQDERVAFCNSRLAELSGYAIEELVGSEFVILLPEEERARVLDIHRRRLRGEPAPALYEVVLRHRDGSRIDVEVSGTVITLGGRTATLSFLRDITDRKQAEAEHSRLEEQLRQSQKLEAIGRLAGGVAHDFNNLLHVILGTNHLVMKGLAPDDKRRQDLEQVQAAGERAGALTRQLLAFSRRQVMRPVDLDLNDLVANLMKMVRRMIGEDLALDIVPGPELANVRADPGQVEQVVVNLCVNARDAMPNGGSVTIATQNVQIDPDFVETHPWAKPGRYVLLSVTDTGTGIDEETRKRMFEPFFTTKPVGTGTGLGLSTAYGIVKQHGGMIDAESEVDVGSVFKVYLPVVARGAAQEARRGPEPPPTGTETVLLAEDETAVLRLVRRTLEEAGYTVLSARDGEEALRVFSARADEIDLLLLDVVMPRMGGRAVLDSIRSAGKSLPCLFMSGYDEEAVHTDFVLDEGIQLIQKPCDPPALLRRVREVLDA